MKILGNKTILGKDEDKKVEAPLLVNPNKESQNDESLIDFLMIWFLIICPQP